VLLDVSHLFAAHTTWIGFRRGLLLRKYMVEFIRLFAPHIDKRLLDRVREAPDDSAVTALCAELVLPVK
jgi:LysR family cys regulon transcriptional activator